MLTQPTPGTPANWTSSTTRTSWEDVSNLPPVYSVASQRLRPSSCGGAFPAGRRGRGLMATIELLKDSRTRESWWVASPPSILIETKSLYRSRPSSENDRRTVNCGTRLYRKNLSTPKAFRIARRHAIDWPRPHLLRGSGQGWRH